MAGNIDPDWLHTLQQLMHYYLPPLERSPGTLGGCAALVAVGLVLTFRSARVAQWLVTAVGLAVGTLAGWKLASMFDWPVAITAAAAALAVGLFAYRTHQWWLAAGSVVALVGAAFAYQAVSTGDIARWLPTAAVQAASGDGVRLPSKSEQVKNLYADQQERLTQVWERVASDLRAWGVRGWLVPAAGLVLGVLLAVWALRIIAIVWIALIGSVMAVSGGAGLLLTQWPDAQSAMIQRPHVLLGVVGGLCLLGLFWQAKTARFGGGTAKPAESGG